LKKKKSKTNVNVGPHPPWSFEFDDGPDENIGKRFFIRVACSWMVLASSKNVQKEVSQFTVMVTHGAPSSSDFFFTLAQSAIQHPAADEQVVLIGEFDDMGTLTNTHTFGVHVPLDLSLTLAQSAFQHPAADELVVLKGDFGNVGTFTNTHAHAPGAHVSLDFFSTLAQSAKQHPAADEPVVLEWDFDFGGSFINTTSNHMPGVHVSLVFVSTLAQSAIQHPAADERVALAKFRDYMTRAYTHAHADAPLACGLLDFYLCASAIRILAPCGGRASVYLGVL
jgi:hypothetical protein